MSFLVPAMLWGVIAASIPIALHFFFRTRYKTVAWAAMKYLLDSIEQTSRRLRFQELLLLAMRVALLLLLVLALARPTSSRIVSGGNEAVDTVLVFDVSYSMDAREGNETRLAKAKRAAGAILDRLPLRSTAQIITTADRGAWLGPRVASNLDQARRLIDSLEVTQMASDLLPGMKEAMTAFSRGDNANKEVYVFTDMQPLGWQRSGTELTNTLQTIHDKGTVYFIRCGTRMPKNVSIVGLVSQSGIPQAGERAPFAVLLRNTGDKPVKNLTVSLASDHQGEKETQAVGEILPGENKSLTLMVKLPQAGLHVVTATIEQDELDSDNRFDRVVQVRDKVRLLVIDGTLNEQQPEKSSSFYLLHALMPVAEADRSRYYVQPTLISPARATASLLEEADACILVNAPLELDPEKKTESLSSAFTDALANFVQQGHGLMIFSGDRVKPSLYNECFLVRHHLLPAKMVEAEVMAVGSGTRLNRQSATGTLQVFAQDDYYKPLNGIEIFGRMKVDDPMATGASKETEPGFVAGEVLLRYEDKTPAVAARQVGRGRVLLVTTSADVRWTDWPRWQGMYVPFVDLALKYTLGDQAGEHNLQAGEMLRFHPDERYAMVPCMMIDPHGKIFRLAAPEMIGGRQVINSPETDWAGIYSLTCSERAMAASGADRTKRSGMSLVDVLPDMPFAVTPHLSESSDLSMLPESEVDARIGFSAAHFSADEDFTDFSPRERNNREWSMSLLWAAFFLGLFETGFAWYCGQSR